MQEDEVLTSALRSPLRPKWYIRPPGYWPPRTTLSSEFLMICATNVAEQVSGRSGITVGANALKCQIEGFGPPPEKYK